MLCLLSALVQWLLPRLMGVVAIVSTCRYSFVPQAAQKRLIFLFWHCDFATCFLPNPPCRSCSMHTANLPACSVLCLHFCFLFPALFSSQILPDPFWGLKALCWCSGCVPHTLCHLPSPLTQLLPARSPCPPHPIPTSSTRMPCSCSNNSCPEYLPLALGLEC